MEVSLLTAGLTSMLTVAVKSNDRGGGRDRLERGLGVELHCDREAMGESLHPSTFILVRMRTHKEERVLLLVRCRDLRGSNTGRGVPISEVSCSQEVET